MPAYLVLLFSFFRRKTQRLVTGKTTGGLTELSEFTRNWREFLLAISLTCHYQHTLDAKGRLFIPAKLREELGDTFYVTVSPEKCLSAYSQENWKGISEKAAAMSNVQQRKVRPLFAYAARCELDGQGRILLPQHLREFAGLIKSVTVVGSNNHAEFWDSARWDEICPLEALPENIAAVMEELDF